MTSTDRGATAARWWPWLSLPAAASALVSGGLALGAASGFPFLSDVEALINVPLALGFSSIAAAIWATRPHPVGMLRLGALFSVVGMASALVIPLHTWAHAAGHPALDLPGIAFAGWMGGWVWALGAAPLMALGILLYPDGQLPSRDWWPAAAIGVTAVVMIAAGAMVQASGVAAGATLAAVGFPLLLCATGLGLAALVVRFRTAGSDGDVRGQIVSLLLAGSVVLIAAVVPDHDNAATLTLSLAAGMALPVAVGSAVVRHGLLDREAQLAAQLDDVKTSRRTLVSEREEERARLRRDLHDGLGPSLASIGLGLRRLQRETLTGGAQADVELLAAEVRRAVTEVRRICEGLQPEALTELGLVEALRSSLDRLSADGRPAITLTAGPIRSLPAAVEVAAFRIVLEAVTNAVRHADAGTIDVRLEAGDWLTAEVHDDGAGIDPGRDAGVGTRTMRERAEELGGSVTIASSPGRGTTVQLAIPGAAS